MLSKRLIRRYYIWICASTKAHLSTAYTERAAKITSIQRQTANGSKRSKELTLVRILFLKINLFFIIHTIKFKWYFKLSYSTENIWNDRIWCVPLRREIATIAVVLRLNFRIWIGPNSNACVIFSVSDFDLIHLEIIYKY